VIVARNEFDLFLAGYYEIEEKPEDEKFNEINFTNSVFLNKNGNWLNALKYGYRLNCGYWGSGPRELHKFLGKHSGESEESLFQYIAGNKVLKYHFENKEIETYDSYFG